MNAEKIVGYIPATRAFFEDRTVLPSPNEPDAPSIDMELTLDGETDPKCPHGCRKTKPMHWLETAWYCPRCGDEWTPDEQP